MLSLLHAFSCQYANTLLLSILIIFCNFFSVSLPSFVLKINKGTKFYLEARTVKIAVTLQFSCPRVLIFTFLDPIFCTVVHGGLFKYKGVSSMFAIAFNFIIIFASKFNVTVYKFLHSFQVILRKFFRNMGASSKS